jgi:hypothetical protein
MTWTPATGAERRRRMNTDPLRRSKVDPRRVGGGVQEAVEPGVVVEAESGVAGLLGVEGR